MLRLLPLLAALSAGTAHAFCGTFVGTADAPTNGASQVAIVRQGERTTLTVANDVHGDTRDFAMVVPVPTMLPEDAIRVVDPVVFAHLASYSAPRLVSYRCEDFADADADTDTDSDSDTDADSDTDTDVVVEAQYIVGEYDVQILAAEESESLVDWLQDNGYRVPDASAALLGEYIAGGSHFFAARVRPEAEIADGAMLSPLQFSYGSEVFGLPIRIGTLNSPGEQDLIVYAVTDYEDGAVGVSNYPEVEVEAECMLQPGDNLDDRVSDDIDAAFASESRASWLTEYAWGQGGCDPCTGGELSEQDLVSIGYAPDYHYGLYYFFTRLHLWYTPQQAAADLVLYPSRLTQNRQLRYIENNEQLEDRFPLCETGFAESPGTCDPEEDGVDDADDVARDAAEEARRDEAARGCATGGAPSRRMGAIPAGLLVAALLARRRKA